LTNNALADFLEGAMRKLIFLALLTAIASHAQDFKSEGLPSDRERPDYVLGDSLQRWAGAQVNWAEAA